MSRYFTRPAAIKPRAEWYDNAPLLPQLSVTDHEAIDTGLIDHRGDSIMRAPNPIGFGRDGEW